MILKQSIEGILHYFSGLMDRQRRWQRMEKRSKRIMITRIGG